MAQYTVRDPQGVYDDQVVEVPFTLSTYDRRPLNINQVEAVVVRIRD